MSRYRIYILFSVVVAAGLLGVFLVLRGFYPIALVNGDFISARQFAKEYRAAALYYQNALRTYEQALEGAENLTPQKLQLAVINGLIEKSLISAGAKEEAGDDLGYLIDNKLNRFAGDTELARAGAVLYGLSGKDFRRNVLVPQAEREILAGRLFLRGENVDEWIRNAKEAASVAIFSPKFEWNGEGVIRGN